MPESREMTRNELVAAKWIVNNDEGWAACVGHPSGPRLTEQLGKLLDGIEAPLAARISELVAQRDALRSTSERLRAETTWVPCSERMPDSPGAYLTTVEAIHGDESMHEVLGVEWNGRKWEIPFEAPGIAIRVLAYRSFPVPWSAPAQEDGNAPS